MAYVPGTLPPTYVAGFHDEAAVRKMPYRQFGARVVSQLTFGVSAIGGCYGDAGGQAEANTLIREAIRRGINLIDAAPWYGHGKAESVLGEALKGIPREAYYVTTKCARYNPGPLEMFDFTYERTVASVKESLARLQLSYIDTLQVHDPEFAPSLDVVVSETLRALHDCQKAGLIRAVGITGYPLDMLRELHAKATAAGIPVASCLSYSHYCLHDPSLVASGTAAYMAQHGVGVLNGSPLSMSLLTSAGAPAWHPAKPALKAIATAAAAHCAAAGVSFERVAMAFALATPHIPTTLFSTSKLPKLLANIDQTTGDAPLTPDEARVMAELQAPPFFGGEGYAAIASWEGVEVQKVHAKIGRLLMSEWYAAAAAARAGAGGAGGEGAGAGGPPSAFGGVGGFIAASNAALSGATTKVAAGFSPQPSPGSPGAK